MLPRQCRWRGRQRRGRAGRVGGSHGPVTGKGAKCSAIWAGVCLDRVELGLRQASDAGGQLGACRRGIAAAHCRSHHDSWNTSTAANAPTSSKSVARRPHSGRSPAYRLGFRHDTFAPLHAKASDSDRGCKGKTAIPMQFQGKQLTGTLAVASVASDQPAGPSLVVNRVRSRVTCNPANTSTPCSAASSGTASSSSCRVSVQSRGQAG